MSLDGIAIRVLSQELHQQLAGAKVDKIGQPGKNQLLFQLRQPGQSLKLFASIQSRSTRLVISEADYKNPPQPPLFAMVLRKNLTGSVISDVSQPAWERIIRIRFAGRNDIGDPAEYELVCELMGKSSNIILLDEKGRILDALRRVGAHTNRYRQIQPGLDYVEPPPQDKAPLESLNEEALASLAYGGQEDGQSMAKTLLGGLAGIGPQTAQEICIRAGIDPDTDSSFLGEVDFIRLWRVLQTLQERLQDEAWEPTIVFDRDDEPLAFAPFPLLQFEGLPQKLFPNMSSMLESYYAYKESQTRYRQQEHALRRRLRTELDRAEKKLGHQMDTVAKAKRSEKYRLYGELLTANLHALSQGPEAHVINFYDPEQKVLTIPMKSEQSPNENAQRYFKRYQRAQKGAEMAQLEASKTQIEIDYLKSIIEGVDLAQNLDDLQDIRHELVQAGYAKAQGHPKRKKDKQAPPKALHVPYQGYDIYVGKNNRQNDYVSFKIGRNKDLWLHTKDIHGAHVIVKSQGDAPIPEEVQEFAAHLAAYFSKGRQSSQVPVDATLRKFVKKPSGAAPGMVIYTNQTTYYVTPDKDRIQAQLTQGD